MNGEGDCYEAAAKLLYAHRSCPGIVLVHGTVTGQGPIAGLRYGHAWVEVGDVVLDPSNGRFVVARKPAYYAAGEITEPVACYTFAEAAREMIETGHYGPWEKRPSPTTTGTAATPTTPDKRGTFRPLSLHKTGRPSPPKNGEKNGWTQRGRLREDKGMMKTTTTTTTIDETTSAGCFLAALSSFAALPAAQQQQLLRDVLAGRESAAELQNVREQLAEGVRDAEDEEIADALIMGIEGDE